MPEQALQLSAYSVGRPDPYHDRWDGDSVRATGRLPTHSRNTE